MIPLVINCSWTHFSNHTQINRWKLLKKNSFFFFVHSKTLVLDLGWMVVSLKVMILDYWSWWEMLRNDICCLCLVTFWKSHFSRHNHQLKLSHFAFRVNGTPSQNPRPIFNLFRCHESIGGLKIAKRATVGKLIFQGKPLCIALCAIFVYMLLGLCFGNRPHPQTRLDE